MSISIYRETHTNWWKESNIERFSAKLIWNNTMIHFCSQKVAKLKRWPRLEQLNSNLHLPNLSPAAADAPPLLNRSVCWVSLLLIFLFFSGNFSSQSEFWIELKLNWNFFSFSYHTVLFSEYDYSSIFWFCFCIDETLRSWNLKIWVFFWCKIASWVVDLV
jgi:hypothetical protein